MSKRSEKQREKEKFHALGALCYNGIETLIYRDGGGFVHVKLTVQERLKDLRTSRHMTLEELAAETGLSRSALGGYESDAGNEMSPYAVVQLAQYFQVSTDYLLGVTDIKNHSNTELHALHLSDKMIDLLMSGRINNRLLCEVALHPDFPRLMTDMEVCVDRIADMRVEAMRQLLAHSRTLVAQKYSPGEQDLQMRTLELADVSEDLFFGHVLKEDLEKIVKDIRAAHIDDSTTADEGDSPLEMTQRLQDDVEAELRTALESKSTLSEKRARTLAVSLQLKYDKQPEAVQKSLAHLAMLSPVFNTTISQRGKQRGPAKSHGKKKWK